MACAITRRAGPAGWSVASAVLIVVSLAAGLTACGAPPAPAAPGVVEVVAAENFWGSIASAVGGAHVRVTSIITNPDADPHSYEPTPADGRAVAGAGLVIDNGVGYDPWMPELLGATGGHRPVLTVGAVVGSPPDGNPHLWYNPHNVEAMIAAYVAELSALDHADTAYFTAQASTFEGSTLAGYYRLIGAIKARYGGTPVGASESIFAPLAAAAGLDLITPATALRAVSEGTELSASDLSMIDRQIRLHQIKLYVYNVQNTTPDIAQQLDACHAEGIPVARITETLSPASDTYAGWQTTELEAIFAALGRS